jgi:hypothetical protein
MQSFARGAIAAFSTTGSGAPACGLDTLRHPTRVGSPAPLPLLALAQVGSTWDIAVTPEAAAATHALLAAARPWSRRRGVAIGCYSYAWEEEE